MRKSCLTIAACATLLWAGAALATPTAQQSCESARITAWKGYQSCVETLVAKDAKGVNFDYDASFAKCRHAYFRSWSAFQSNSKLAGSTCIGSRFLDNGDGTVTDNLSGLIWEKKGNLDSTVNPADPHDADNVYTWSTVSPWAENGTAFTDFLETLNSGAGFAGANGWRLPTIVELQTIEADFACRGLGGGPTCSCPSTPCVDPALGPTQPDYHSSATSAVISTQQTWSLNFADGSVGVFGADKSSGSYVRAVRGGL